MCVCGCVYVCVRERERERRTIEKISFFILTDLFSISVATRVHTNRLKSLQFTNKCDDDNLSPNMMIMADIILNNIISASE